MPLDTITLKQVLKDAFTKVKQVQNLTPEQQLESLCQDMAVGFEAFVKSGDVTVNVQTTGTASAQTGTGTGKLQ